jgi:hypothetical protein
MSHASLFLPTKVGRSTACLKKRGASPNAFPIKLFRMLKEAEESGKESIVSWVSEGRAFLVHKPDQFVEEILPFYFRQTKYRSFQRQLNLYGFKRLTVGPHRGAYEHPCLARDDTGLCTNTSNRHTSDNASTTKHVGEEDEDGDIENEKGDTRLSFVMGKHFFFLEPDREEESRLLAHERLSFRHFGRRRDDHLNEEKASFSSASICAAAVF